MEINKKTLPQEVYEQVYEPEIGEGQLSGVRFKNSEVYPFELRIRKAAKQLTSKRGRRFDG